MKIIEARDALVNTLKNIKEENAAKGIITEYKCFASDRDLIEVDIDDKNAALIAGEISFGAGGTDEKIILECAVCISDGEVIEDEVIGAVTSLRDSLHEFYAKIDEAGSVVKALEEIYQEADEPAPEIKTYDNKKFYIYGGIIIALVAVILILTKVL